MTWKAYALVSGAGVLATYLTLPHPTVSPDPAQVRRTAAPQTKAPSFDIREQATRLATRVRPDAEYHEPSRDPFHFSARPVRPAQAARPETAAPAAPQLPQVAPPPPLPELKLSGITTRMSGGSAHRTAILITPQGVVEVAEGDSVAGQYRVVHVEENAIELSGPDGASRRLTLR